MKNAMNKDGKADNSTQPSSAKGSTAGVELTAGGVDTMLGQLLQVLGQITHSVDGESSDSTTAAADGKLMGLANQLAENLHGQDTDTAEPTMQVVLEIIDTLADMLDNGQIKLANDGDVAANPA